MAEPTSADGQEWALRSPPLATVLVSRRLLSQRASWFVPPPLVKPSRVESLLLHVKTRCRPKAFQQNGTGPSLGVASAEARKWPYTPGAVLTTTGHSISWPSVAEPGGTVERLLRATAVATMETSTAVGRAAASKPFLDNIQDGTEAVGAWGLTSDVLRMLVGASAQGLSGLPE